MIFYHHAENVPKFWSPYSITNQLPFSCDESRKQLLQVALKSPAEDKETQEATVSLADAKEIRMDAAVATRYNMNIYIAKCTHFFLFQKFILFIFKIININNLQFNSKNVKFKNIYKDQ